MRRCGLGPDSAQVRLGSESDRARPIVTRRHGRRDGPSDGHRDRDAQALGPTVGPGPNGAGGRAGSRSPWLGRTQRVVTESQPNVPASDHGLADELTGRLVFARKLTSSTTCCNSNKQPAMVCNAHELDAVLRSYQLLIQQLIINYLLCLCGPLCRYKTVCSNCSGIEGSCSHCQCRFVAFESASIFLLML